MMKKVLLIILAIVVCVIAGGLYLAHSVYRDVMQAIASGCSNCVQVNNGGPMIKGSGNITTQNRTVPPFTSIRLESPADVVIDRTGTQSVSVSADDNLVDFFTSEVKDGTLYLGVANDKSFQARSVAYRITVADLRAIEVRGSGDVEADHLDGPVLSVSIMGSGDMRLAGRTDDFTLSISGSGDIDAANLNAKRAKAVIRGSGDATVNASEALDVQISGSGDLHYVGSPKLTQDVRGSGSVEPK
jgi:putative autotransporter adhesin-like protein